MYCTPFVLLFHSEHVDGHVGYANPFQNHLPATGNTASADGHNPGVPETLPNPRAKNNSGRHRTRNRGSPLRGKSARASAVRGGAHHSVHRTSEVHHQSQKGSKNLIDMLVGLNGRANKLIKICDQAKFSDLSVQYRMREVRGKMERTLPEFVGVFDMADHVLVVHTLSVYRDGPACRGCCMLS